MTTGTYKPILVAVHGGIGAGKSIVCQCVKAMGYKVFDCDSEAKRLMDHSESIKNAIISEIDQKAITSEGKIDRARLSSIVFSDKERLEKLNKIVHQSVRDEITRWVDSNKTEELLFVETAILYQSGIDRMADKVIEVVAPIEIRILRAMKRSGISREDVVGRIESQKFNVENPHHDTFTIINDGDRAILPQLISFLNQI